MTNRSGSLIARTTRCPSGSREPIATGAAAGAATRAASAVVVTGPDCALAAPAIPRAARIFRKMTDVRPRVTHMALYSSRDDATDTETEFLDDVTACRTIAR